MTKPKTDSEDRLDLSESSTELEDLESSDTGSAADRPAEAETEYEEIEIELPEEAAQYVEQLRKELEAALSARQRALADFRNYQRRALENEQQALAVGARRVITSLLPVLDHFDLALNQDLETITVDKLLNGVQIVRDEVTKALQLQGVDVIEPEIGDEFDPNRHEAMMRQAAEGIEPNHIVAVVQAGYVMGDMVLRPAKVAVAPVEDD